jgi:hypothetical protein
MVTSIFEEAATSRKLLVTAYKTAPIHPDQMRGERTVARSLPRRPHTAKQMNTNQIFINSVLQAMQHAWGNKKHTI